MTMRARIEWGDPRPPEWRGPCEPLSARLPPDLVRQVRVRARAQGVSVSQMVQRLLEAGLQNRPTATGPAHSDLVTTLFD
ncbi:MAG: BrnA antitoxin family protein [Actinobacteria bacterium]|nr:BrnA antitoxin family protein [Actinomycetota bacterium]MBU1492994.1 BrnA antitoxin family protein [Actinomycetota bacterium]